MSEEVQSIGDGPPDLSDVPLDNLSELDDSVLAHAVARVREDTSSAAAGFQNRV